jgi:predicted ATPase
VLLAVDDVHLADEPSLRRLLYLARHLVDVPLLMVLTRRTGRHQAALTELVLHPRCTVVRPCPLSVASTSAVLADLLGVRPAAELVRSCHGLTAGNPLLTRALGLSLSGLSDWDGATLPTSAVRVVADLLLAWLSDLTEDAQEFARALAVLGDTRDREPGRDRLPDLSRLGPDRPGREDKTPGRFPVPQRLPRLAINRPATDALKDPFKTVAMSRTCRWRR